MAAQDVQCDGLGQIPQIDSEAILEVLPLETPPRGFETGSPYPSNRIDQSIPVSAWWSGLDRTQSVCAVHIEDDGYRLQTYFFPHSAVSEGAIITHRYHCGTCSSLQDLEVYLETSDLTTPARACAQRRSISAMADCMEELGFSRPCAETWAFNAQHTRKRCASTCLAYYGLGSVLLGRFEEPNNLPDGSLNPCLACDEERSGPGFQFAAGRTRRGSGIVSAIDRSEDEVYAVDHSLLPGCHIQPLP